LNHHRTFVGVDGVEIHIAPGTAWSIGPRAFEIAACGAFQLCDDTRPELAEVFGDTVATYSSAEDLRNQIGYYLAHDDEREEMAWRSYCRVQGCTFEARAREIVIPVLEEAI
jgi:spore maturation protein CgeB